MKRWLWHLLLLPLALARAQEPATNGVVTNAAPAAEAPFATTGQLALRVKSRIASDSEAAGAGGETSRATQRALELTLTVQNLTRSPRRCQVHWFALANPKQKSVVDYIFDHGSSDLTVGPNATVAVEAKTKKIVSYTSTYNWLTSRSGETIRGYIVVLRGGDQILAVASSPRTAGDVVKDEVKWRELLTRSNIAW